MHSVLNYVSMQDHQLEYAANIRLFRKRFTLPAFIQQDMRDRWGL